MAFSSYTQYFNKTLGLTCFLIGVSQFNYGFDNQAFATTQAMDAFAEQFGVYNPKTKLYEMEPYFLSLLNSLIFIGLAVGLLVGSEISRRFGRRMCMFVMSLYALVSATIVITSKTKAQILTARILNYVYIGIELSVVPIFQAEISPRQVRGLIVGTYQFSLITGGLVINAICRGTSSINGNASWQIPYGMFYIIPTIIASCIWFVPESPRWLLLNDKPEQAQASLRRLRSGAFTDEQIDEEIAMHQAGLANEVEKGRYWEIFQGVNLKRTAVAVGVNFFLQATGQAFVSKYGAVFIKSLGTVNPFDMTLINAAINLVSVGATLFLNDKFGRRPLLLFGAAVQALALFTMGALGTFSPTTPIKTGIVALMSIFTAAFSFGWAPLSYVITSELPALRLRDYTQRTAGLVNVVTNFVTAFTLPYLLNDPYANLQSKVGFIFGSIAVLAFIFTFFCVPECRGKSFEQIDVLFNDGIPLRKFGKVQAEVVANSEKTGETENNVVSVVHNEKV